MRLFDEFSFFLLDFKRPMVMKFFDCRKEDIKKCKESIKKILVSNIGTLLVQNIMPRFGLEGIFEYSLFFKTHTSEIAKY